MSVLEHATQQLANVRDSEGAIQTQPFLDVCRLVLPVVDKLGTAFALVKSDISGNIQRLADKAATNPAHYQGLFTIIEDDVAAGTSGESSSCTKGLLWLKRAMQFTLAIIKQTMQQPDVALDKVVYDTYSSTLMQYHGWIVSSAFTLAFKFVPGRQEFHDSISEGSSVNVASQMQAFVAAFEPVLQEIHTYLANKGLDDPVKV